MRALSINMLVAVIWMLLQAEVSLFHIVVGFGLGLGLLAAFPDVFGGRDYVRRVVALARFVGVFLWEFLFSCIQLLRACLFLPVSRLRPAIITYNLGGLTKLETLLLSHCISLTPGTTTVDVAPDFSHLVLHVLESEHPDQVRSRIDQRLRRGILSFTR